MTQKNLIRLEKEKRFSFIRINSDGSRGTWISVLSMSQVFKEMLLCCRVGLRAVVIEETETKGAQKIIEQLYGVNYWIDAPTQTDKDFFNKIQPHGFDYSDLKEYKI